MRGDVPAALVPLGRALTLAEPEGYVRVFVDDGAAVARCCEAAVKRADRPDYAPRLLTAFGRGADRTPGQQDRSTR